MEEQRKHAILFATTLLSAQKMIDWMEFHKPYLVKKYFVDKPNQEVAFIFEKDRHGPTPALADQMDLRSVKASAN
jgi:hypothetical protein